MHPKLLLATSLLTLNLVSASPAPQDSTSSCPGINVLNTCVTTTTDITQSCLSTDYNCLCQKWTDVLTYVFLSAHFLTPSLLSVNLIVQP